MRRSDFAIIIPNNDNPKFVYLKFLYDNPEHDNIYGQYYKSNIEEILSDCADYNKILVSSIDEVNKRIGD